ncbi:hypothetical protein BD324DRAFT_642311 [Kockovaella imperatae]|uniref:Peptide hydrolase n=1 Tax=Kockovaella imperatae TaxID=4999 RepID=A0A1Y1UF35_9TREE|nr:hypothetical protein BD324DRAFT_642311 [Kockovaella imperatae]ORX36681.1 hypothetical protein BD324DRAFT_642311 [Kockovaella imperatae]
MLSADNAGTGHVHKDLLPILDLLLPTHISVVALPERPMPHPKASFDTMDNDWGVPHKYAMRLATFTDQLEHDPSLATVVDSINVDTLRRNVRWLTGEAPSGIESRHSFTKGALQAAHWIKKQVQEAGASCELMHYMEGFAPNVICEFPNNSSEHVVLSAHYDSRGSFGMTRAPGADDDASGSGHLLGVVDAIKRYKIKFDKKVIVAFFSGEEQGLFGSRAYAGHLKDTNREVLLHIQADMLGYHVPGEPMQLALPATIHLPEASYFVGNVSKLYSPELVVGSTQACCSDHQSFLSLGFPATQVFERNGPIADPMYHNSGDLSFREGYDFDQIVAIAKVTMASIMIVAGWSQGQ